MTIRAKLYAAFGTIAITLLVAGIGSAIYLRWISATLSVATDRSREVETKALPLLVAMEEARYDVIQVQQFLSDISATRGQDGLDDGFKEADAFAVKFRKHIAEAAAIARDAGAEETLRTIQAIGAAFPAYQDSGIRLAQAYVNGGPEAGNKEMPNFDSKADALTKMIESVTADVRVYSTVTAGNAANAAGDSAKALALLVTLSLVGVFASFAVVIGGVRILRNGMARFAAMTELMRRLSQGDLEVAIPAPTTRDEAAEMAAALQVFRENALERRRQEQAKQEEFTRQAERQRRMEQITRHFEGVVTGLLDHVRESVDHLDASAGTLSANAEQAYRQSAAVSAAAESAAGGIAVVASAGTELTASIREIGQQMDRSANIARDAVGRAGDANGRLSGLSTQTDKIGEVVSLINTIASQTNLLALNATIESARAGEAGKGFAVVANEVKNLAGQTARATDEIVGQINSVQESTRSAVSAVENMAAIIGGIDELATTIAGAVTEQEAATAEIARNAIQASEGIGEVATNIGEVAAAAAETGRMAETVAAAASQLKNDRTDLHQAITAFLADMRAVQTGVASASDTHDMELFG